MKFQSNSIAMIWLLNTIQRFLIRIESNTFFQLVNILIKNPVNFFFTSCILVKENIKLVNMRFLTIFCKEAYP